LRKENTPNTDDAAVDIDECMSEDDNSEGEEDVSLTQGEAEATNLEAKVRSQAKAETTNDGAATNKQAQDLELDDEDVDLTWTATVFPVFLLYSQNNQT
jgi:hypothetical protein